jgi:hypothetical protein
VLTLSTTKGGTLVNETTKNLPRSRRLDAIRTVCEGKRSDTPRTSCQGREGQEGGELGVNDRTEGMIEGLSIALYLAQKNQKTPKRIEPQLAKELQSLTSVVGKDGISDIRFWAQIAQSQ